MIACQRIFCQLVAQSTVHRSHSASIHVLQEVRFVDIGEEAVAAIVQSLQRQAPHAQIQHHPDLAAALIKDVEFEYVNGMEWGFHNAELNQDIAYSVSCILKVAPVWLTLFGSERAACIVTGS